MKIVIKGNLILLFCFLVINPLPSHANSDLAEQCKPIFTPKHWGSMGDEYSTFKADHPKYVYRTDGSAKRVDQLLERAFTPILEQMATKVEALERSQLQTLVKNRYENTKQYRPMPFVRRTSSPRHAIQKLYSVLDEVVELANKGLYGSDSEEVRARVWKVPGKDYSSYRFLDLIQVYLDYKSGKTSGLISAPEGYRENVSEEKWQQINAAIIAGNEKVKPLERSLDLFWETYLKNRDGSELFEENFSHITFMQANNGGGKDYSGLSSFSKFDFAEVSVDSLNVGGTFQQIPLGVGDYGASFNQKLRVAAQVLIDIVIENLQPLGQELENQAEGLILEQTVRGMDSRIAKTEVPDEELSPTILATIEGIVTLVQLLKFTMGKSQPELGTSSQLVEQILTPLQGKPNSLVVYLTRYTRSFLIGPSTLSGYHFPDPFTRKENGDLMISTKFKDYLVQVMNRSVEKQDNKRAEHPEHFATHRAAVGTPCPVSCHTTGVTGIQHLADAFLKIFKIVDQELPDKANF